MNALGDAFEHAAVADARRALPWWRSSLFARGHFSAQPVHGDVRLYAGQQFAGGEGLDQVVVGAGFQALDSASSPARAESMTMGMAAVGGSDRSARSSAKPSRRGIITSVRTRSGGCCHGLTRGPVCAVGDRRHARSAAASRRWTYSRMSPLSSASRMRARLSRASLRSSEDDPALLGEISDERPASAAGSPAASAAPPPHKRAAPRPLAPGLSRALDRPAGR